MRLITGCICLLSVAIAAGCASNSEAPGAVSKTAKDAGLGAVAGAVVGAAVNHKNRGKGAAIGAALGGAAGAALGYRADKQDAELRAQLTGSGVDIEDAGDAIKVVLPGGVGFGSGSAVLRQTAYKDLNAVAASLREHPSATVQVVGHTDRKGQNAPNDLLSLQRAQAVGRYLVAQGVAAERVETLGMGASQPIADNKTVMGRSRNRRVEIKIKSPPEADTNTP